MSFDFRDLSQFDAPQPEIRPLSMVDNPVQTLQALYTRAVELRDFYAARGEDLAAASWSGQAMAFACLLRDHYDWDEGTRLVQLLPLGA